MAELDLSGITKKKFEEEDQDVTVGGGISPGDVKLGAPTPKADPPPEAEAEAEPDPEKIDLSGITSDAFKQEDNANIDFNAQQNPVEVRRDRKLATALDVDERLVHDNVSMASAIVKARDLRDGTNNHPKTQAILASHYGSAVTDDVDVLKNLEDIAQDTADKSREFTSGAMMMFGRGLSGLGRNYEIWSRNFTNLIGLGGVAKTLDENIPLPWYLNPEQILSRPGVTIKGAAKTVDTKSQTVASDIARGLGQLTGQVALAALTRGGSVRSATTLNTLKKAITNPWSLLMMFGQGSDVIAERVDKKGAKGPMADTAIIGGGAITAFTERFGLERLLKHLPQNVKKRLRSTLWDIIQSGGFEAGQEVTEGIAHDFLTVAMVDPDHKMFQGLDREAIAAGGSAAIFRAIVHTVVKGRKMRTDHVRAKQAEMYKDRISKALDAAEISKTATENPEVFMEVVRRIVADTDMENVRVSAAGVQQLFQQSDNPQGVFEFFEAAGIERAEVEKAANLGLDIEVATPSFISAIRDQDMRELVLLNVRMDMDANTEAEVQSFKKESDEQIQEAIVKFKESISEADLDNPSVLPGRIKDMVTEKIMKTGKYSAEGAQYIGDMFEAAVSTTLADYREKTGNDMKGEEVLKELFGELDIRAESFGEPAPADTLTFEGFNVDADGLPTTRLETDPTGGELSQSAVPLQRRPMPLEGTGRAGRITNWDMGTALDQRHMDKYGEVLDPQNNEEHYKIVLDSLNREYINQNREEDAGTGWYLEDIRRAVEVTTAIIPELSNPVNRDMFLTLAALLSPQQKPGPNWEYAIQAMQGYLMTGKIPLKKPNGKNWGVNAKGLELFQHLIESKSGLFVGKAHGLEQAIQFIQAAHLGKDLASVRRDSDIFKEKDKLAGYKANETTLAEYFFGAYMFGPKVGDFMMNATGFDQDAVTVDLWLARTYNRLIGRVTDVTPGARKKKQIVSELRGVKERALIKRLVRDLAGKNNVDPSAMQAALWFFEQRLYKNHGINTTSENFSGAAEAAAKKRSISVPRAS